MPNYPIFVTKKLEVARDLGDTPVTPIIFEDTGLLIIIHHTEDGDIWNGHFRPNGESCKPIDREAIRKNSYLYLLSIVQLINFNLELQSISGYDLAPSTHIFGYTNYEMNKFRESLFGSIDHLHDGERIYQSAEVNGDYKWSLNLESLTRAYLKGMEMINEENEIKDTKFFRRLIEANQYFEKTNP